VDKTPKAQETKEKLTVGNRSLKSFCTAKETIYSVKRQPIQWELILTAIHLTKG
jgi:hypothetical protein